MHVYFLLGHTFYASDIQLYSTSDGDEEELVGSFHQDKETIHQNNCDHCEVPHYISLPLCACHVWNTEGLLLFLIFVYSTMGCLNQPQISHWLKKSSSARNDKNHDCEKDSCKTCSPAILSLRFPFFSLPFLLRGQLSLSSFLTAILSNIMNLDNNLRNRKRAWKIHLNVKIKTVLHKLTIARFNRNKVTSCAFFALNLMSPRLPSLLFLNI